jgi:hypothetical protein
MTLIYVANSNGCVGRCDSRCYEAVMPDCHCICGGKNHGVGLERAKSNTEELAKQKLTEWQKQGVYIAPELLQKALL